MWQSEQNQNSFAFYNRGYKLNCSQVAAYIATERQNLSDISDKGKSQNEYLILFITVNLILFL